jgi:hypothetical protein
MEFSSNFHSQEVVAGPSSVRCFRFKNRFLWMGFRTGTSPLLQETKWHRTKMFSLILPSVSRIIEWISTVSVQVYIKSFGGPTRLELPL